MFVYGTYITLPLFDQFVMTLISVSCSVIFSYVQCNRDSIIVLI